MKHSYHHGELRAAAIQKTIELIEIRREVNFTLREISKLLKVSHTAFYRHFSSKQALLVAIAEEGFKELNTEFQTVCGSQSTRNLLEEHCTRYIMFAFANQGQFRSMFHQELRCGADLPQSFIEITEKSYDLLRESIRLERPKLLAKNDIELVTKSVWASIHGFSLLLIDGQFSDLTNQSKVKKAIETHLKLIGI